MALQQLSPAPPAQSGDRLTAAPGSVRLLRLLGFDIDIHWSWPIIVLLFTWSLASDYLPDVYPGWTSQQHWLAGAITSVLFFISVLAHELAHSVVARRRGVPARGITLFIFGGVSALGDEPRTARDEFTIAIVGPLTSFAAGALFAVVWLLARAQDVTGLAAVAGYLAYINVAVGIFNLLPGFPLDGGRVLRSLVWGRNQDMLAATRVAANAGRVVAAVLIGLGILSLFGQGGLGGVWFIVIGWFLWNAAESIYQELLAQNRLGGLTVGPLAEPAATRVPPDATLHQLVHDYILPHNQRAFFVGPEAGEVLGLVTLSDLRRQQQERWDTTIFVAMTPRERLVVVTPETKAGEALRLMAEHNVNQLPVLIGRDFGGLLTRAALIRALQFRDQIGVRRTPAATPVSHVEGTSAAASP
jgi:Zn-dependent protease/CBS domain-containing protein